MRRPPTGGHYIKGADAMFSISVCMIVKNEEKVIGRCLSCVRSFADEIIVVDTGSSDETIAIAREMGAVVYEQEWTDDFAAARNYSFSKANCDYQMWLDADDVIDQINQEKILALKQDMDPNTDVVMMTYEMSHASYEAPLKFERERLVKTNRHFQWEGRVHENIRYSGSILHTDICIRHQKEYINDPNRNLKIFESMLKEGETFTERDLYYYARELKDHGRYDEAITCYKSFLKQGGWKEDLIQACCDLGHCYLHIQEKKKALTAYFHSFVYERPVSRICNAIGAWMMEEKRFEEAVYWYQQSLCSKHRGGFENQDEHLFLPAYQLSVCYYYLDEKKAACHWFYAAKKCHPKHPLIVENERFHKKGILSD